jgi:hypothetical protein
VAWRITNVPPNTAAPAASRAASLSPRRPLEDRASKTAAPVLVVAAIVMA